MLEVTLLRSVLLLASTPSHPPHDTSTVMGTWSPWTTSGSTSIVTATCRVYHHVVKQLHRWYGSLLDTVALHGTTPDGSTDHTSRMQYSVTPDTQWMSSMRCRDVTLLVVPHSIWSSRVLVYPTDPIVPSSMSSTSACHPVPRRDMLSSITFLVTHVGV